MKHSKHTKTKYTYTRQCYKHLTINIAFRIHTFLLLTLLILPSLFYFCLPGKIGHINFLHAVFFAFIMELSPSYGFVRSAL